MAPRWFGNPAFEPVGGLKDVAIVRETLTIDLRPLASVEPALVEATYHLDNSGPTRRLELVFVAGSEEVSDFEVRLGGRPLKSQRVPPGELQRRWKEMPASWMVGGSMPGSSGLPGIDGPSGFVPLRDPDWDPAITLQAFSVELPSGKSTLQARYRAQAARSSERYPTATWYLFYLLAPARAWGNFGRLDVTVHLPSGWPHVSTPDLGREGDTLRGTFSGLPADALVLGTRMPHRPALVRSACLMALPILALLADGVFCWLSGSWIGSALAWRRCGPMTARACIGLSAVVLGFLGAALVLLASVTAITSLYKLPGDQVSPYYEYRFFYPGCGFLLLTLLAFPLSIWAVQAGAYSRLQRRGAEDAGVVDDGSRHL
jgi:hypothetical protein